MTLGRQINSHRDVGAQRHFLFDARDYGAKGDGTTDDRAAIQEAISEAAEVGGTVWLPGTHLIASSGGTSWNGIAYGLLVAASGVTVAGPKGARLVSSLTGSARLLVFSRATGEDVAPTRTVYAMSAAAIGATSLTLTTAADAGNFAAGDWIHVRTGQTIENAGNREPDAELNQVISADADTGVVVLRWPTAKAYAAENIDTGGGFTYKSAVGGAGDATSLGIQRVTDVVVTDVVVRDIGITHTTATGAAINHEWCVGPVIEGVDGRSASKFHTCAVHRGARFVGNRIHITGDESDGQTPWWLATATGCTDTVIRGNDLSASVPAYVHIHEGSADVDCSGNRISTPGSDGVDYTPVSVRARAYRVGVKDNTIRGFGTAAGIYVDSLCVGGGTVKGNVVRPLAGTGSSYVSVTAAGEWRVTENDVGAGTVNLRDSSIRARVERLAGWVYHNRQTTFLGTIPPSALILAGYVYVHTAFDSDGTDNISVGFTGSTAGFFTNTDVSTTGRKAPTFSGSGLVETSRDASAYYTNGGSEPTAGRALVVVEYVEIEGRT